MKAVERCLGDCFAALLQADLKLSGTALDESWIIEWPAMSVSLGCVQGALYCANQVLEAQICTVPVIPTVSSVCDMKPGLSESWWGENGNNILLLLLPFVYIFFPPIAVAYWIIDSEVSKMKKKQKAQWSSSVFLMASTDFCITLIFRNI